MIATTTSPKFLKILKMKIIFLLTLRGESKGRPEFYQLDEARLQYAKFLSVARSKLRLEFV